MKRMRNWIVMVGVLAMPVIAQAGPGPYYVQEHFRWRNDNGTASTATWKAAADVVATNVPHYQNIRLRFCISNQGQGYGNFWPNFEYATATNGPWTSVAPASGGAFAFEFSDSTWFTNSAPAGNLISGTGTFLDEGAMVERDDGNIDVHVSFDPGTYINTELCIRPSAKAKGGTTYYFRLNEPMAISQHAALTMEAYDPPEPPKIVSALSGVTVMVERVGYGLNDLPEKPYRILTSGSEPMTYEAQNLPAGYALFGDTIADDGTPSTPGTYNVTITARNAYGSDTRMLSMTVANGQVPAYRTLASGVSGETGKPFRFELPVAGTAPIGCRMEVVGGGGLPAGLSFDGVRTISGTPQAAGMTRLLMTATNAANATGGGPAMRVILTITGSGVADADGDGMTDSWEIQYFGSTSAPTGAPDADADNDGMTNLAEFTAGTNPTDAGSVLAIGAVGTVGAPDKFVVSWDSVSGKTYGVEKSTNLSTGAWQPVAGGIPGHAPVNAYTDSVGSAAGGFYRVKVE